MMDQRTKEWLKTESEAWVTDGIITQQQALAIQTRYCTVKTTNPLFTLFAILGTLLIGAGIILVFATNWWSLPIELRIALAFLPLLLAQGIGLYTIRNRYTSASFREGSAVLLSLTFFAALALIGQIFHTPSDLSTYLLVCILFTLPGAYLFSSKAALSIYVFGSLFVAWDWPWWYHLSLTLLALPYFYWALKGGSHRRGTNYLLLLLSVMGSTTVTVFADYTTPMESALLCGLSMLLIDALFHKISSAYFFTSAKLLAILCITATLLITSLFLSYSDQASWKGLFMTACFAAAYFVLRRKVSPTLASTDLIFTAAVLLVLSAQAAGIVSCLLAIGLGAFFIVCGSKSLMLGKLNYGMFLIVWMILVRFFDSSLGLFARGIVFILLGIAFLIINLSVSRKRKGMQR